MCTSQFDRYVASKIASSKEINKTGRLLTRSAAQACNQSQATTTDKHTYRADRLRCKHSTREPFTESGLRALRMRSTNNRVTNSYDRFLYAFIIIFEWRKKIYESKQQKASFILYGPRKLSISIWMNKKIGRTHICIEGLYACYTCPNSRFSHLMERVNLFQWAFL